MSDFILKLLGARVESAGDIAGVRLAFQGGVGGFWFVFFLVVLGGLAWWSYHRTPVSLTPRRKWTLFGLRCAFLLLLTVLLLRPVLAFTVEGSIRRALLVLVDGSGSMGIKDPRVLPGDIQRAAIAGGQIDPTHEEDLPAVASAPMQNSSRFEIAQAVLQSKALDLLPQLDEEFDLVPFSYGQSLSSLPRPTGTNENAELRKQPTPEDFPWLTRLNTDGQATAIGEALREVVNRKRGQPLAGVVLITDGANNQGLSPREAATQLKQENIPLYVYGVGITSPRDIIVTNLMAPEVAFVGDELLVNVRVRSQGLEGEKAKVFLKLDGEKVDEKEITFGPDGEQVVPLRFLPENAGEYEINAGIDPRDDETEMKNNSLSRQLRIVDAKIKVLLVEETPRWEYRYLHAMLSRDRRIDLTTVLYEGDPSITHGENAPFQENFPANRDELFKYDLVIFGDVEPRRISRLQMQYLNEFVSRFGGAFIMVAGKRHSPAQYRGTPIENLLPIEFNAPLGDTGQEAVADKPIQLELTTAGRESTMLQLSDQAGENIRRWKALPAVYWIARVVRAKPGAEVLVVDPDPLKATRFGPMPVVAVQQYGLGQSLFVGTDNTWRWRRNVGDKFYYTFWGQIIQRLSLSHVLGGSRRTQIDLDKPNYQAGERVRVYARLYRAGFEPVTDSSVQAFYTAKDDVLATATELKLRPVPDQPGLYRGNFIAPDPGQYEFAVEMDREARTPFYVSSASFELGDTAMNEDLLREMAEISGGEFFREENLHELPARIARKAEKVRSPMEVELWSSPLYFILILLVVTVEWILRKLSYLK
jgi:hypothetical protein